MKKSIAIILIVLLILICTNIPSYALGFVVGVKPDQTTVAPGSSVTVVLSLNNMNVGGSGMKVFSCTIDYDENIFEPIERESIAGLNEWKDVSYNTQNKKILLERDTFISSDSEICKITFKVKEGTTAESAQIKIINPSTSNNKMDIDGTGGQVTIALKKLSSGKYEITGDNKIKDIPPNTTLDELKKNLTGGENTTIKDKDGNTISSGNVGTGATVTTSSGDVYTVIVKGDVNGDGKFTTTDISKLKLHLIDLEVLQEPYKTAADVSKDGLISSTDLAKFKKAITGIEEL